MTSEKLIRLAFQKISKRKLHGSIYRSSNWRDITKKELNSEKPEEKDLVCIYKVPSNMREVKPKAYTPKNISIGPYHHGAPHLQDMEVLKTKFYRRLFDSKSNHSSEAKLDEAFKFLEEQETKVRGCYTDKINLNKDEFLQMMLVDGAFTVQLMRDQSMYGIHRVPCLSRWMIPILQREMIMLENQIPLFVLIKLFELTSNSTPSQPFKSFEELALEFFYPLLVVDSENVPECVKVDVLKNKHHHILDLLRSSIRPKLNGEEPRGIQRHMVRSITELMEAGVKIKADESRQLLDISFEKKWGFGRKLTIPPLNINDHRGTVFRNIVAFEKCHKDCHPDVTTYLFFFNGLIDSPEDVALLHYKGVLHHSLGNNKAVSKLINNITKEIIRDKNESYLYKVVKDVDLYCTSWYPRMIRVPLVHHYFTSWVAGVSIFGALLALYLTWLDTVYSYAGAIKDLENESFGSLALGALCIPVKVLLKMLLQNLKETFGLDHQGRLWLRDFLQEFLKNYRVSIC